MGLTLREGCMSGGGIGLYERGHGYLCFRTGADLGLVYSLMTAVTGSAMATPS